MIDFDIQNEEISIRLLSDPVDFDLGSSYVIKDHSLLNNRDIADQHPMSAITGLNQAILDLQDAIDTLVPALALVAEKAKLSVGIPFGEVDSDSTSTAFTATVPGITELKDGTIIMLKNGVISSASGCTLDVNGLGAKRIHYSMAADSALTTTFNINYTALMYYDSSRNSGDGAWVFYYGYYTSSNTIGYQIRTNSTRMRMSSVVYRYRLLFTSQDGQYYVPANNSTSTNATTSRNTVSEKIDPFGRICYYGTTASVAAGSMPAAAYLWDQYVVTLGYSFAKGSALSMTAHRPVYLKCDPQTDGSVIIDNSQPWVQQLPSSEDSKVYIFLGIAIDATTMELFKDHPAYYYSNGAVRHWTGQ